MGSPGGGCSATGRIPVAAVGTLIAVPNSSDHLLAADIATAAGELLLAVRDELADEPEQFRMDEGDRRAHDFIVQQLGSERPNDAVLSEEGQDDHARLKVDRVWIVDPLDGTREFGEPGRTDWAVHVALCSGGSPIAGAVALPALGITLSTAAPGVVAPSTGAAPRVISSRSRPGPAAEAISLAMGGELLFMGSAGAKAMAVVRGEADVYAHTGGQFEWDNCAPAAVAEAAGFHVSRIDGSPLRYNNADPYLPDLLICRPELAAAAIEAASGF